MKKMLGPFLALLVSGAALAGTVALNPNHPSRHVVVKGDTLWGIATRFLRDSWLWPDIWYVNPQIKNPHLIYPGDVISLVYVGGKPQLRLERRAAVSGPPSGVEVLQPRVRVQPLPTAIPTIPLDAIAPFLNRSMVISEAELRNAPYIVENSGEHVVAGAGNTVYVRGIHTRQDSRYAVVQPGPAYRDPVTHEILGYQALYVGSARVERYNDPATLRLTRSRMEASVGDRLLPAEHERFNPNFYPHAPSHPVQGTIIAVLGGVSQIGQLNTVVLNVGRHNGMKVGDVLAVYQAGPVVRDRVKGGTVKLPDERAGVLIVYRIFERVSYGLIMQATRPLHVLDKVRNP